MPIRLRLLILALAAFLGVARGEPLKLEVIPLKHRTAQEVIPVLQPLLPKGANLSAFNQQLIVQTTPANLAEIRKVLAQIDTAPRRLRITVWQNAAASGSEAGAAIGSNGAGVGAQVYGSDFARHDLGTQQVQVLEGNSALVQIAEARPLPNRTLVQDPFGTRVIDTFEYRTATSGFWVLPRVAGERVTVDIRPQREAFARGRIASQQIATQVSGRLGEWIELGALGQDRAAQGSGVATRSTGTRGERQVILLKVEEAP